MSGDLVVPGDDDIAAAMAEAAQLGEQAAQMTQAASSGGELVPAGSHDAEHTRAAMIEARQQSAAVAAKMRIARRKAMDAIEAQRAKLDRSGLGVYFEVKKREPWRVTVSELPPPPPSSSNRKRKDMASSS